jgi:oligoendopeptidase F
MHYPGDANPTHKKELYMVLTLPTTAFEFMDWSWQQIEPHFHDLAARPLNSDSITAWLADWTHLSVLLQETHQRLYVAATVNTADEEASRHYHAFLDEIYPQAQAGDHILKEKLLRSGLQPAGFEMPLRNIRAEVDLYHEENLPLLGDELKYWVEYDQIIGAQTVQWEGEETTLLQLTPVYQSPDRSRRERAWRLAANRQLVDRDRINDLWVRLMDLRRQLADNAGYPDYRAYRWQQLYRFDYTPENCKQFHAAIEKVVVPAVQRCYERRRQRLGLERLRPWDLDADTFGRPRLKPFGDVNELVEKTASIFHHVDPQLGAYFDIMRRENLLDLENRKSKAPGGYCTEFNFIRRPFIFMNSVGLHDDVLTLLHEGGHAFHVFEMAHLPYAQQLVVGMEFLEVASMAMELLGSPYLSPDHNGFYTPQEASRARAEHLLSALRFWPYMAVVDAFQHWAFENHAAATDPSNCDAAWRDLWQRFMIGVDWSGLDEIMTTGWQRKAHLIQTPFYYIEYGLAQLGAIQIWRNSLRDQAGAVAAYRKALSLGGTVPLPQLYQTAGANLAFDEDSLGEATALIEKTILNLEAETQAAFPIQAN